jgi:hypothetical protein
LAVAAEASRKTPRRAKGKVVRVERNQPKIASDAHLCQLYEADVGHCRRPVAVGDRGAVIDENGVYGQAPITSVSPVVDACGNEVSWSIELDTSQLARRDYAYNASLLVGHVLADDARLLPPRGAAPADRPGEQIVAVVDDDGDRGGDLLVSTYGCDEPGVGTRSSKAAMTCHDTWIEVRDEWRLARTDTVPTCY